jgi:hypothetical protein
MDITENELGAMRTLIAYAVHSTDANISLELFDNYMNTSSKPSLDTHNALRTQQIRYIGDKFDKLISAIFRNEKINITKN